MTELKQEQLSLVRKYPLETLVAFLFLCVITLAGYAIKINNKVDAYSAKIMEYMVNDHRNMIEVIEKNTNVIERLNYQNQPLK